MREEQVEEQIHVVKKKRDSKIQFYNKNGEKDVGDRYEGKRLKPRKKKPRESIKYNVNRKTGVMDEMPNLSRGRRKLLKN